MSYPLYQIDAFSNKPFAGNPAAVVLMDSEQAEGWYQQVAAEMNLSETAFLREHTGKIGHYDLRELGKDELRAFQASPRGGELIVIPAGERVYLRGQAVIVSEGTLRAN